LSNNTLSRAELSNDGNILNVHYGDVLIKYGDILNVKHEDIPFIKPDSNVKRNDVFLSNGDIIIADTAEDETVGKACEVYGMTNEHIVSGLHTIPCRPKLKYAPMFLGYYINSSFYHKQLLTLMQGIKVLSISKSNIANTAIRFPSIEEQSKVSSFFYLLDERISKQRELVENLKSYKRGALSAIFNRKIRFKDEDGKEFPEWSSSKIGNIFTE
jgi:type I restriction enzyme S subunit